MVTAKAPLSFYDLVQRMKGKRTIGNWDILVTYDEESLNERLAEEADRNKLLDDVAVDTTIPSEYGTRHARWRLFHKLTWRLRLTTGFFPHGEVPAHVTLKLASPAVSFGPGEDEAHLRLNVGGQYMVEGDEIPTRFPEGYRIDIRASLAAATGHFDDNHFKKAETEQQAGAGVVLRVPDDPGLLCGVYLDLGKGSAHWTLIDQDGKPAKGSTAEDVRGFVVTAVEAFVCPLMASLRNLIADFRTARPAICPLVHRRNSSNGGERRWEPPRAGNVPVHHPPRGSCRS
jgi:hypothetical protein